MTTAPSTTPEPAHGSTFSTDNLERLMHPRNKRQHDRFGNAEARAFQQNMSSRQGLRNCGRSPIAGASVVPVRLYKNEKGSPFAATGNTQRCDISFCLSCGPQKDRIRREELELYIAAHQATGGEVYAFRFSLASSFYETGTFYSQERAFLASDYFKQHRYAETNIGHDVYTRDSAKADFLQYNTEPDSWDSWGFTAQLAAFGEVKSRTFGRLAGGTWTKTRILYDVCAITSNVEIRVTPAAQGFGVNDFGRNWQFTAMNPHCRLFIMTRRLLTEDEEERLSSSLKEQWVKKATRLGWKATVAGQHFTHLDTTTAEARSRIASYQHKGANQNHQATRVKKTEAQLREDAHAVALQSFPGERTHAQVELERTSYDPLQALADAMPYRAADGTMRDGDPHALTWYHQYENAVEGTNVVSWTPTARKVHSVQEKQKALAEERKAGRTVEDVAHVPTGEAFNTLRAQPHLLPRLLTLAENSKQPVDDVAAVLEENNIVNLVPTPEVGTPEDSRREALRYKLLRQSY
ncbi:hypothetical protein ACVLV4_000428 [Rathayibacter agropyri]